MKMYPDGVVEGTPEELAAFKHIDAALARRGGQLAIEAAPKKRRGRRTHTDMTPEAVLDFVQARGGVTAADLAAQFAVSTKAAYARLYYLRSKGQLWLTGEGIFKIKTAPDAARNAPALIELAAGS